MLENKPTSIRQAFVPKKAAALIVGASFIASVGLASLNSTNAFAQAQSMKSKSERVFAKMENERKSAKAKKHLKAKEPYGKNKADAMRKIEENNKAATEGNSKWELAWIFVKVGALIAVVVPAIYAGAAFFGRTMDKLEKNHEEKKAAKQKMKEAKAIAKRKNEGEHIENQINMLKSGISKTSNLDEMKLFQERLLELMNMVKLIKFDESILLRQSMDKLICIYNSKLENITDTHNSKLEEVYGRLSSEPNETLIRITYPKIPTSGDVMEEKKHETSHGEELRVELKKFKALPKDVYRAKLEEAEQRPDFKDELAKCKAKWSEWQNRLSFAENTEDAKRVIEMISKERYEYNTLLLEKGISLFEVINRNTYADGIVYLNITSSKLGLGVTY